MIPLILVKGFSYADRWRRLDRTKHWLAKDKKNALIGYLWKDWEDTENQESITINIPADHQLTKDSLKSIMVKSVKTRGAYERFYGIFIEKLSADEYPSIYSSTDGKKKVSFTITKSYTTSHLDGKESLLLPADKSFIDYNFAMYRAVSYGWIWKSFNKKPF